jgi:hypothetical protein
LLERSLQRLPSLDVDAAFLLGDTLDPAYGAAYAERHGADENRDFWWSWQSAGRAWPENRPVC